MSNIGWALGRCFSSDFFLISAIKKKIKDKHKVRKKHIDPRI